MFDANPTPGAWAPSRLRRLSREPRTYWALALGLAVVTYLVVDQVTADARALRADYGETTLVRVATENLHPGAPIEGGSELRPIPRGLVPDGALTEGSAASGTDDSVALVNITRGSMITEAAIQDPETAATTAGRATLAITNDSTIPPLDPGNAVLIVVNADPFSGIEPDIIDALATDVSEDRIVVSVDLADLARTSAALRDGAATIARRG